MNAIVLPPDPLTLSVAAGQEPGPLPDHPHVPIPVAYRALDPGLILRTAPDLVMCWLFCARYDAVDVARILCACRFEGRLVIAAPALPRPALVERELRTQFPSLDILLRSPVSLPGRVAAYHAQVKTRESA